jgi:hypothetical protein
MVEKSIVHKVDEKLRGGTIDYGGSCHGQGTSRIFQAIISLVFYLGIGLLHFHLLGKTAPLDHETVDHTMVDRTVIVAFLRIGHEVFHTDRCLFGVKFRYDGAFVCLNGNPDHFLSLFGMDG